MALRVNAVPTATVDEGDTVSVVVVLLAAQTGTQKINRAVAKVKFLIAEMRQGASIEEFLSVLVVRRGTDFQLGVRGARVSDPKGPN